MMRNLLLPILLISNCIAFGQWNPDPAINNLECDNTSYKTDLDLVSDGERGALMFWTDLRNNSIIIGEGSGYDIYAQRFDSIGTPLWDIEGVRITTAQKNQLLPKGVSDNAGGMILIWEDNRFSAPYDDSIVLSIQRIDADGNLLWGDDGIQVTSYKFSTPNYLSYQIVSDNAGGAIVAFYGYSDDLDKSKYIFASRINAGGEFVWQESVICTTVWDVDEIALLADGVGGALIGWDDIRDLEYSIAVQHISSDGETSWIDNGVRMTNIYNKQYLPPVLALDAAGGYYVAWSDTRNTVTQIFIQRLNAAGELLWEENGIALSSDTEYSIEYKMHNNADGNVFIVWATSLLPALKNVYAQMLNTEGEKLWGDEPLDVFSSTVNNEQKPHIVADGFGGAIISVVEVTANDTIKTININEDGTINGAQINVATGPGSIKIVYDVLHSFDNNWIYSWVEAKEVDSFKVYASRIAFESVDTPVSIESVNEKNNVLIYPNPFAQTIFISSTDFIKRIMITDFTGKIVFNDLSNQTNAIDLSFLPAGIYTIQLIAQHKVYSYLIEKL